MADDTTRHDEPTTRRESLQADLQELHRQLHRRVGRNTAAVVLGVLLCLAGPILYAVFQSLAAWLAPIYGVLGLLVPWIRPASQVETEIRSVESEIDLLDLSNASFEERAEKLFKRHEVQLKKYYEQTLRHTAWIFMIGVGCLLAGFAVIGLAVYLVHTATAQREMANELNAAQQSDTLGTDNTEKIIIATLGAIGGILANFIAVIYLKMHSETLKSLTEFHNRLVVTHHLHFANFLAAKITTPETRESVLAAMAQSITQAGADG